MSSCSQKPFLVLVLKNVSYGTQHVTIINFRLKYGAKTVAPKSKKKSRNRRKNNKEKVIKINFHNQTNFEKEFIKLN